MFFSHWKPNSEQSLYKNHIWAESSYTECHNLVSDGDIGFVDFQNKDFHITQQSLAYNYATGLSDFPATDFKNTPRSSERLDAGADQFENSTQVENTIDNSFVSVSPNPTNDYINLQFSSLAPFEVYIYNLQGAIVRKITNEKIINVGNLANGIYLLNIKSKNNTLTYKLLKQ